MNFKVSKPSYFVALDLLKKKLVITIRSTDCLRDSITNLNWNPVKVPGTQDSLGWYSHEVNYLSICFVVPIFNFYRFCFTKKGMTKAAVNIKNELTSKKILEKALNFDKVSKSYLF